MTTQMLKTPAASTTDSRLLSAEELSTAPAMLSEEELNGVAGGYAPGELQRRQAFKHGIIVGIHPLGAGLLSLWKSL